MHDYNGVETFLKMKKIHKYFLAQQDARKKHDIHVNANDLVIAKLDAIPDEITDKKELTTIKKLKELRLSLNAKIDMLISKAFNLYQQLLSPSLGSEWDKTTSSKNTASRQAGSKNNVVSAENRGQDWDTLKECKRLHPRTM